MYEEYWQLESKPFTAPEDAAGFFASEAHSGAHLKLRYAIDQRRAAAVLAGPAGVGKTLLIDRMIDELGDGASPVVRVVFPQMSSRDLLGYLAEQLGAPPLGDGPLRYTLDESVARIERVLSATAADGRHALLVIDEAHLLEDTGLLETIRLLLNLGGATQPSMTLLLVGQMGLLSTLGRTPALEERVAVKSLLRALTVGETGEYLQHRLNAAGATREIFTRDAVEMMHVLTGGVPRRIDRLGDLALVIGFADGVPTIDADHLESVSRELLTVSPE